MHGLGEQTEASCNMIAYHSTGEALGRSQLLLPKRDWSVGVYEWEYQMDYIISSLVSTVTIITAIQFAR